MTRKTRHFSPRMPLGAGIAGDQGPALLGSPGNRYHPLQVEIHLRNPGLRQGFSLSYAGCYSFFMWQDRPLKRDLGNAFK
jgi:hypothetical protein